MAGYYAPSHIPPTYHWWHGSSGGTTNASHKQSFYHKMTDQKKDKLSQLNAALLVKDRLATELKMTAEELNVYLAEVKIRIYDFAVDGELGNLLEAVGFKPEIVKPFQVSSYLIQAKQPNNQLVIISGLFQMQPREVFQALYNFVHEGGRLIFINSTSGVLPLCFGPKLTPGPPSTVVRAGLRIISDKELFSGYEPSEQIELEQVRESLEVKDKNEVKVLAKIHGSREEPLAVRMAVGDGQIYVFTSKLYTREKTVENLREYLVKKGASPITMATWECAQTIGYKDAVSMSISVFPFIEMITKLFVRESEHVKKFPQPAEEAKAAEPEPTPQ
ncbi:hypothetical protein PROFUN_09433 [Planoprotostelium fungivorum]|uniref:Uncharacterized protein n=1 Tax=Planoprotostelium fungivorum TaxID=1890364 RepID=A0A2P6NHH1_9EUKA|nr:hypothetical protein PROFUN_09433 [Planoprotostelium fungivorum]